MELKNIKCFRRAVSIVNPKFKLSALDDKKMLDTVTYVYEDKSGNEFMKIMKYL